MKKFWFLKSGFRRPTSASGPAIWWPQIITTNGGPAMRPILGGPSSMCVSLPGIGALTEGQLVKM